MAWGKLQGGDKHLEREEDQGRAAQGRPVGASRGEAKMKAITKKKGLAAVRTPRRLPEEPARRGRSQAASRTNQESGKIFKVFQFPFSASVIWLTKPDRNP